MSISNTTFVKGDKFDWNKKYGKCPACNAYDKPKGGKLFVRKAKGKEFLGCDRYPDCKFTTGSFRKKNDKREWKGSTKKRKKKFKKKKRFNF